MSDSDRTDFVTVVLAATGDLTPLFDAADGMRADMERRGWSRSDAERAALTWLNGALGRIWNPAS